jgi:hypothetical protein
MSTEPTPSTLSPDDSGGWAGPYVRYDIVKEFVIALVVMTALAVGLTVLFSSPDDPPTTIKQWARTDPSDFLTTAVNELNGSSDSAGYGPPYNNTPDASQKIGPISLQSAVGVHEPINTATDFVIDPLRSIPGDRGLTRALVTYERAPLALQKRWTDAYTTALPKIRFLGGLPLAPPGAYGPVAPMMRSLVGLAQSGGLDGVLLATKQFYETDYTKPLLFLADSGLLATRANGQHLAGDQWGMMNETGSYPGQVWLWLYTFWYQVEPFKSSSNADALVWAVMAALSLAFVCIPFIPGVRSLPQHLRVYRLIWRDHYQRMEN